MPDHHVSDTKASGARVTRREAPVSSSEACRVPLETSQLLFSVMGFLLIASIAVFTRGTVEEWMMFVAVAFGVTQLGGLCGHTHLNTMALLWRIRRRQWLPAVVAYTLCGAVSSAAVGLCVWGVGYLLGLPQLDQSRLVRIGLAALGFVLAAREAGILRFRLPEWPVQTDRNWMYTFGWVTAAGMWGFHIGLAFVTVITYGGFWLLVAFAFVTASPAAAVSLFLLYWAGRSLPLWMAPALALSDRTDAGLSYRTYRPIHLSALSLASFILAVK